MTYVKQTWANGPAGLTPISASRLSHIEDGIEAIHLQVREGPLNLLDPRVGADNTGTVDTSAALETVATLLPSGGTAFAPPGIYRIDNTVDWTDRRSFVLQGAGTGHAGLNTGTIFRWGGGAGGTMFNLDGFSSSSFRRLLIDGVAKTLGIGIHISFGPSVASQMNTFEEIVLANCQTGMQAGVTGAGEGNNDQSELRKCWLRDNNVGLLVNGDQSIQWWFTGGTQFANNSEAAIRTGSTSLNGGGVNVFGGYFGGNAIDLDLRRINGATTITGVHSELAGEFLRHDAAAGTAERVISLTNCWQNSAAVGATKSMTFTSGNSLLAVGCRFVLPVEVDNKASVVAAHRTFINTEVTVTKLGPTNPYRVFYIARPSGATMLEGDITLPDVELGVGNVLKAKDAGGTARNLARMRGSVGVHTGGEVVIGNGATSTIGAAADLTGLLMVRRVATDRVGLFIVHSGTVLEFSDPQNIFSTTQGTASQVNVYVTASNLTIENLSGSGQTFRLALLGASAT